MPTYTFRMEKENRALLRREIGRMKRILACYHENEQQPFVEYQNAYDTMNNVIDVLVCLFFYSSLLYSEENS